MVYRLRKLKDNLQLANNLGQFSICIEQEKAKKLHNRLDRYDKKQYSAKRKKLREELLIGEKALVLAERIKKKAAPGKFYKQSVQKYLTSIREGIYNNKNSTNRRYKILLTKRSPKQQKTSKDFKELNYLLLRAILLCDCIFLVYHQCKTDTVIFMIET